MPSLVDLARAPTSSFEPTDAHAVLPRFVGAWRGTTRLWLDADGDPEQSTTELSAELILGGRWLRLEYRGTACGEPHAGEMLIGFHKDGAEYQLAWIDSFHTASGIMLFTGPHAGGDVVNVLGSYTAGGQRWGWRNVLRRLSPGELAIESFNISPEGQESKAIATLLTPSS
ncbi:MAG TPA: DUF1579 family protein [Polyangiaceae bacterium]|nr:DUF1579 family protein [Polyangiaceae bacterium]